MNNSPAVTVAAPLCLIPSAWPGILRQLVQTSCQPRTFVADHHTTDWGRPSLPDSDDKWTLPLTVAVKTIPELLGNAVEVLPKAGDGTQNRETLANLAENGRERPGELRHGSSYLL